ncbi:unnamed protein product [Knipowitschia caucasica]|uniref:Uncharacterized protein n=1 Tax=Knipowitschia caucasica TaxID=637954 RepID=A0AAV2J025_KNICA
MTSHSDFCKSLPDWLNVLRLEQYEETFLSAGLTTLLECRTLTQERLEQMGINLPGHQRRILSSLSKTLVPCDTTASLPQDPHSTFMEEKSEHEDAMMDKLVPKQRQVLGKKAVLTEDGEKVLTEDVKKVRPVPKQRSKYRAADPVSTDLTLNKVALPPVPPRSTPNCPPHPFTSSKTPPPISPRQHKQQAMPVVPRRSTRSSKSPTHTLDQPPTAPLCQARPLSLPSQLLNYTISNGDRKRISSTVSPISPPTEDTMAPPLPPKCGTGPKGQPPQPQRATASRKVQSLPIAIKSPDGTENDPTPQVLPRIKTSHSQENIQQLTLPTLPSQPSQLEETPAPSPRSLAPPPPRESRLDSVDDDSDAYEDPDQLYTGAQQNRPLQMAKPQRYSALCSDDEQLDDDDSSLWSSNSPQGSIYLSPNREERRRGSSWDDSTQETAILKSGWLDKNPPQGVLYYQRRWVKLDADYLRYFDNEKAVYSKGFISTAFITNVSSVGELKFEVVTNNRTFIFRAESEAERDEWVAMLKACTGGPQYRNTISPGSPLAPDFYGYLVLRGIRSRLYTAVAMDKVFLYKNMDDYRIGVGITSIDMNVGNVKETDQRTFDLTTPYRTFSFIAESEQLKDQWVEAMHNSIDEALSNSEVAERIWEEASNSLCADCGAPKPVWAAINLCVVVCQHCAGEHRRLGPSISKVRSLKMDRKVWTEELIQVFLLMGNDRVNSFWAANVPPSEALRQSSCPEARRQYITNKYRQGKYRKYHQLFGNQKELNNALCINVQGSDVLETLRLIFCGADVNCSTGMPESPSPLTLAQASSQPLQAELLSHNLNTELPQSEVGDITDTMPYSAPSSVCLNGFLFKTASMKGAITDRKAKEGLFQKIKH